MSENAMGQGRRPDRYRVTKPLSGGHIALAAVGILGVILVAGLVEGTFGFGNIVVVGLLVPAVMRWYLVSRTAIMIDRSGVVLDRQSVRWYEADEVVLRSGDGPHIGVELRRRAGATGASIARGEVPLSRSSPEELRAAFRRFGPSGIVLDEPESDEATATHSRATSGRRVGDIPHATDLADGWRSGGGPGRTEPLRRAETRHSSRRRHSGGIRDGTGPRLLRWADRHDHAAVSIAYVAIVVLLVVGVAVGVSSMRDDPEVVEEDFAAFYPQDFFPVAGDAVEDGELVGPHFGLAIERVTVADALEHPTGREPPDHEERPGNFRAPDGHQLVVAVLDWHLLAANQVIRSPDDTAQLRIWIETGEHTVEMNALPDPAGIAVAAVRDGEDALLVVEDAGREQSISLRTGRRHLSIDGYYSIANQDLDYRYDAAGRAAIAVSLRIVEEGDVTVELDISSARRTPWDPGQGWAPSGRAWLRIMSSSPAGILTSHGDPSDAYLGIAAFRAETVFVLVDESGQETPAVPAELNFTSSSVLLDVPDTFTRGTLRIAPAAGTDFLVQGTYWATPPPEDTVEIDLRTGGR